VKLALYSLQSYVPAGSPHVVMLYPFWGKNYEDPDDPDSGRFDGYAATGDQFFFLAPLEEAEFAVYPRDLSSPGADAALPEFLALAREAGKPAVVFFASDSTEPVEGDALVFRTSLHSSRRRPGEYALPGWSEDFLTRYVGRELPLRRKQSRPVVGFCGFAGAPARSLLVDPRRRGAARGAAVRRRALRLLARDPGIEAHIVRRDKFLGGAIKAGRFDPGALRGARREYVQNMVESDYVLCARGAGNFSYRLYETLSLGRIPVFIDTDCVLPYDFAVDWRDYCVWVDQRELPRIGELVCAFHESLTENEFFDLQRSCRRLWEQYIRPEGFFAEFHRHLGRLEGADRLAAAERTRA
jgi:hypothetical protein